MKRLLSALVAMLLLAVPALGEEAAPATRLMQKLQALAFETPNATLTGSADFSWDGEMFKRVELTQMHDGFDSYQRATFITPHFHDDGTDYTGSYIVYGQGNRVYVLENAEQSSYYGEAGRTVSGSLIRQTPMRSAALTAIEPLLSGMSDNLTETEDGFRFTGATSAAFNGVMTYIALQTARDRGYTLYKPSMYCAAEYEDYDAAFRTWLKRHPEYPAVLSGSFDASLVDYDDPMLMQYNMAQDAFGTELTDELNKHATGVVWVSKDAELHYFESYNDYLLSAGRIVVGYEDYSTARRIYYNQKTGENLDADAFSALQASDDYAKVDAICADMDDAAIAEARKTPDAVAAIVQRDGSVRALTDYDQFDLYQHTLTPRILGSLATIGISDSDVTVTLDDQGRVSSLKGSVDFTVVDTFGDTHALRIVLDAAVTDYGTTTFERFDPKAGGYPSFDEYWAEKSPD